MSDLNDRLREDAPPPDIKPAQKFVAYVLFPVLVLLGLLVWVLVDGQAKTNALREHGEIATAVYVDRYYNQGTRGGKTYFLEYHYGVDEDVYRITKEVQREAWVTPAEEDQEVLVCYEVDRPDNVSFDVEECGVK